MDIQPKNNEHRIFINNRLTPISRYHLLKVKDEYSITNSVSKLQMNEAVPAIELIMSKALWEKFKVLTVSDVYNGEHLMLPRFGATKHRKVMKCLLLSNNLLNTTDKRKFLIKYL
tara:strand:- start:5490 stop:5834 length:345 start_codon:yes stop_codon:yes gene_type:complete